MFAVMLRSEDRRAYFNIFHFEVVFHKKDFLHFRTFAMWTDALSCWHVKLGLAVRWFLPSRCWRTHSCPWLSMFDQRSTNTNSVLPKFSCWFPTKPLHLHQPFNVYWEQLLLSQGRENNSRKNRQDYQIRIFFRWRTLRVAIPCSPIAHVVGHSPTLDSLCFFASRCLRWIFLRTKFFNICT